MLYQVVNVQNLLLLNHIKASLRNEFSSGGTGDLSANDTWVELWLDDERDKALAEKLIAKINDQSDDDWFCSACGEKNSAAFEICWQCQKERSMSD
jgi:hypothetical protein